MYIFSWPSFWQILTLLYLLLGRNDIVPSMFDFNGFNAIIMYIVQHSDIAEHFHGVMYNYVWVFWFNQITLERFTVFDREVRTNNHLKIFHATLLRLIKPHPKICEFIGNVLCVCILYVWLFVEAQLLL